MSDDNKKPDENAGSWAMPEPVFRSTEGYTPRSAMSGAQDDIPTEPGFSDEDDEPTAIPNAAASDSDIEGEGDDSPHQSVRATTKVRVRHHKKRSGCAKVFGVIAGALALTLTTIVMVLVYFLYFYRPAETTF